MGGGENYESKREGYESERKGGGGGGGYESKRKTTTTTKTRDEFRKQKDFESQSIQLGFWAPKTINSVS